MSALLPASFNGAISTRFAQAPVQDDLSSGIQSSFGLIGYKGKVWSIRYRGDEQALMRDDGDGPRGSIEVVILKASSQVSKVFYKDGYVEGSNAAPDCFSNNGVTPEPTSVNKQCASCAACPMNAWGSRITPQGKQGKACADSKRLAVVPQGDIDNEAYGGPMLLRVPAASLQDVAIFGQKMQQMGYPYYSIATKIAFDPNEAFPKFVFSALRPLTDAEADKVLAIRDGHTVNRILSESEFGAPAPQASQTQQEQPLFEQSNAGPKTAADQQVVQQAQQAAVTTQGNAAQGETDAERELRELKAQLAAKQAAAAAAAEAEAKAKAIAEAEAAALAKQQAAQAELAALKAQQDAQQAQVNQAQQPVETDAERELRELKASLALGTTAVVEQSAAGNAPAEQATVQSQAATSNSGQTAQTNASPSDGMNMASEFENSLDDMLAKLLP